MANIKQIKASLYMRYMRWRLLGFARVLFWGDKVQQRFSQHGRWLLAALVVTMIFGANMKASMIYQMFALLLALFVMALLVSILLSISKRKQFDVSRELPAFATVNMPFSYHIRLKNKRQQDVVGLRVTERFNVYMPAVAQFLVAREPLEEQRNWYDRKSGFYRFVWLQKWWRGADFQGAVVPYIQAEQSFDLEMTVMPMRRGAMRFSQLRLALPEPLGLVYRYEQHAQAQVLLVLPKRYHIPPHLTLAGGRKYQQGGVSQTSTVGDSEEFNRLREYRAGDSPRHIHWASLARGSKPLVKEYQDEHFTRQALVLDSFGGASQTYLFEAAVSLAAGFASHVETDDSLLDLMFVHETSEHDVEQLTVGRALAHPEQMLQALASVEGCTSTDFQMLGDAVLRQAESFGACVLIFLAWDEARRELVRQLLAQGMVLRVFILVEQASEAEFEPLLGLEGKWHVLTLGKVQKNLNAIAA